MPTEGKAKVQYTTDGGSTWNDFDFNTAEHIRSKRKIIEKLKFSVGKGDISNLSGGLTVRLQLYDESSDTWNTWFKGETQSAGDIKQDGTVEVTARGGGNKASAEKGSLSLSSTDNKAVLKESFSGSDIDPASTSWSYVIPSDTDVSPYSISSYSSEGKRSRVWHEMTQQYDWALYLETEDQEIRYEPNGYYSSGETIDTSSKATKMTSWEDEIVNERTLVNKVIINYKDSNDNVQEVEEKDSTSIDNYGEYMIRRNIPYITTSTEANNIAQQLLSPNPGTEGKVETYLYKTNLVNETVWIKDSPRNIDGDFVVKEQRNYYPEQRTVLKVGDIDKRMTVPAREGLEHREERSEMLDKRTANVGDQSLSGDADNHDHADGTYSGDSHDHGDGTLGTDNHDHADGTYGADNHDHNDGTYGADNHDHGEGNYETDANTSLSEDSDADNYKDNYFNVLDVDNTQWYSLATLDVPDPRPAYVFGIIDIEDIQGDDEWQFAISLDGSYDIIVDRVNSLDWNYYAPEGSSSNYLMSYYLPASSLIGGYTLRLYARCITGTNDIEGYFRLQWDNHVHSLPATAVKSGTSSGNTEPGVSGNSGNTEPGVSGDSGDTSPGVSGSSGDNSSGVSGSSGSTQPGISGSTDPKDIYVKEENETDR